MAVCRTIRTKLGVSKFLLQSQDGNEPCTAFLYTDNSIEVHSLKKDFAPLYLEENTKVNIINKDDIGMLLAASTLDKATEELFLHFWDLNSSSYFQPKEIQIESSKTTKYLLLHSLEEKIENYIFVSFENFLCIIVNSKHLYLLSIAKFDPNLLQINCKSFLNFLSAITNAVFLTQNKDIYLCLSEGANIHVFLVETDLVSISVTLIPMKHSHGICIVALHKLTCSKCLVIDNIGHLYLFCLPNEVYSLKFPCSIGGHSIFATVAYEQSTDGILALCSGEHTVNLYSLADLFDSIENEVLGYIKPYRVLCSQFPINSITFIQSDQIAMASSVNQSISFWGGFLS
ncbi:uncharacterized protein LOC124813747 [Hydra vulgaris]|uniref:uncharacterized protein LOC124813747 n=1 Tax=Hydra vulgaris TaxID=6087 RepID=UPI001F5F7878|nr:uncharacterized protein LOC124813747 [Hydra vulgaris]